MSEIKIKKVKATDGRLEVSYSKPDPDGKKATVTEEHSGDIHPDLRNAINGLNIHYAVLGEFVRVNNVENYDPALTEDFHANGYSIGCKDDDPGVTITGYKTLKSGKTLTFNTPFERFVADEEKVYRFMDELREQISKIEDEVLAFIHDGKRAPEAQMALEFEEVEK